ncbi:NlpC/P60 family protein [Persephonella hydrogeniphila]|uniref:NlpC/P60 family protein n=1 Tax=Persephonella hydrogeniphila TaxID=198703 RepID=A0A285NME0_9AQUI|nr:C40 family peptidase [Persephonella hydrogeniphila]SNZ10093.1 NlpC/P60 family protein [Persephonella hydrogeniphila]
MRLIILFIGILFSVSAFSKDIKIFENDYYNSLKFKYEKKRYMAVMVDDGIPAPDIQRSIVDFAIGLLGIQYRFGGETIWGMDCSAFVQKVYAMAGIYLPRTARYQAEYGMYVSREDLKPGDLLFFRTYARFPSHVGIYVGEGKMIHASSAGKRIMISDIDKDYYLRRFLFAKRLFLYDPEEMISGEK